MTSDDVDEADESSSAIPLETIQQVCRVSKERAVELWEASSGSLERSLDLNFRLADSKILDGSALGTEHPALSKQQNPTTLEGKKRPTPPRKRQSTLDGFLAVPFSPPVKKRQSPLPMRERKASVRQSEPQQQQQHQGLDCHSSSPSLSRTEHTEQKLIHAEQSDRNCSGPPLPEVTTSPDRPCSPTGTRSNSELLQKDIHDSTKEDAKLQDIIFNSPSGRSMPPVSGQDISNDCSSSNNSHNELSYAYLAEQLQELANTTKRTIKLTILKEFFGKLIQHVGGIHNICPRQEDARVLSCAIDLVLGKLSHPNSPQSTALQVSGAAVASTLQTITGLSRDRMRVCYRQCGDLGDVAATAFDGTFQQRQLSLLKFITVRKSKDPTEHNANPLTTAAAATTLSIVQVHERLASIAAVPPGKNSQAVRKQRVLQLLQTCRGPTEIRFLTRTLVGTMRVGATLKTALAALAMAVHQCSIDVNSPPPSTTSTADPSSAESLSASTSIQILQSIYNVCPLLDKIALALLRGGLLEAQRDCSLQLGVPVHPMLANPAHSLEEVQAFLQEQPALAEWKYDGVRCQAHGWTSASRSDADADDHISITEETQAMTVKLYSRHLLDSTQQYPDVVEHLQLAKKSSVHSFVLDSEIVGVAPLTPSSSNTAGAVENGFRLLPFQDLSRRRAKQSPSATENGGGDDIGSSSSQPRVLVHVFAFDLLYLNGESLLHLPLSARRQRLAEHFEETRGFGMAKSVSLPMGYNEDCITSALSNAVADGAEGLMLKKLSLPSPADESPGRCLTDRGYESGTRSNLWCKLKKDYLRGTADTIDVVPIGAWYGNGRKAVKGFLSPVLLAVYDEEEGVFCSVSRCMSFTDEMYQAMRNFYLDGVPYPPHIGLRDGDPVQVQGETGELPVDEVPADDSEGEQVDVDTERNAVVEIGSSKNEVDNGDDDDDDEASFQELVKSPSSFRANCFAARPSSSVVVTSEDPPIWFRPLEVWQVSYADLTLSPVHTAASGAVSPDRGIALRFPRFQRRRPDKSIVQATTTAQLAQMYLRQSKILPKAASWSLDNKGEEKGIT